VFLADSPSTTNDQVNKVSDSKKSELQSTYGSGKLTVYVDSIEPEGGPITGDTRLLVRGGPFTDMDVIYPSPKCKFGKNE
jgi:hypothetical protein